MSTIKDVAAKAGVSTSTVSAILNKRFHVKPETHDRVMKAVAELGYKPNSMARSLRTNETKTVGLLIPSTNNNSYAMRSKGVEDCALENGYQVFLCHSDRDPARERHQLEALIGKHVDAILMTTFTLEHNNADILSASGIPVISNTIEPELDFVDEVYTDYYSIMCDVMEYIISMGHSKICLLNGPKIYARCADRYDAYLFSMRKHDLPIDESLIFFSDFKRESSYDIACNMFKRENHPTCFITTSEMALGVMNAAYDCNIKIPDDVSIFGWSDSSDVRPRLTVVDEPHYLIGRTMMELAMKRIAGGADLPKQSIKASSCIRLRDSVKDLTK